MIIPRRTGEWILITKEIPIEIYIQPFTVFYGFPTNPIFKDDNHISSHMYGLGRKLEILISENREDKKSLCQMIDLYNRKMEVTDKIKSSLDRMNPIELEYSMKVKTMYGDVVINPDEYKIVNLRNYIEPVKDKHAFIKYMNRNQLKLSGKINEQIFYLRTRGISFVDAVMMISGNIKTQNAFYIEMHREYVKNFFRNWEDIDKKRIRHKNKLREDLIRES